VVEHPAEAIVAGRLESTGPRRWTEDRTRRAAVFHLVWVRSSGPSTGFLVVIGLLLLMAGVVGVLAYGGCEDVGSECHPRLPKLGGIALDLASGTLGYALVRGRR
jgi:hypothetical protein